MITIHFDILKSVAEGSHFIDEILFRTKIKLNTLESAIDSLCKSGSLFVRSGQLFLSQKGLLEYSRGLKEIREKERKLRVKESDSCYFSYICEHKKTVFFQPFLNFEPSYSLLEEEKQFAYEIVIDVGKLDLKQLEALFNVMWDNYTVPGFLITDPSGKGLFGWGIRSLMQAISQIKETYIDVLSLISLDNFLMLVISRAHNGVMKTTTIKMYLTCSAVPYIDTLDTVKARMRPFLENLEIGVPQGKIIEVRSSWKNYPDPFSPNVLSTLNGLTNNVEVPLYAVIDMPTICNDLRKVSPWIVGCRGGFIKSDFHLGMKFSGLRLEVIELPDVDVYEAMVSVV